MKHAWLALAVGTPITILACISAGSWWWLLAWPLYVCMLFIVSVMIDYWWQQRHPDDDWEIDV